MFSAFTGRFIPLTSVLIVLLLPTPAAAKDNCACRSGATPVGHLCVSSAAECKQQCWAQFAAKEFGFSGGDCPQGFSLDLYEYCLDFCSWDRAKVPPRGEGGIEFWGSEKGGAWYMITCKCPDKRHYGIDTDDWCQRQWGGRNSKLRKPKDQAAWSDWACAADMRIPREPDNACKPGFRPCLGSQSDKCCPVSAAKPTTPQ